MLNSEHDTIFAAMTPSGKGALAVLRISGPRTAGILLRLTQRQLPKPGRLVRRRIVDPDDGRALDDALVVFRPGPSTYTGEDLAELHIHGSVVLQRALASLLTQLGAAPAQQGEFTLRAFFSGRMSLLEAESVHDIVEASSTLALKNAANGLLEGWMQVWNNLYEQLLDLATILEAELDFPDEAPTVDDMEFLQRLDGFIGTCDRLLDSFARSQVIRNGFRVLLLGPPNSGKSSLFNSLLGRPRAIVTPEAGTTRDYIEEVLPGPQVSIVLVDTAGLRVAPGEAERAGVERSLEQTSTAHLVLLTINPEDPLGIESLQQLLASSPLEPGTRIWFVLTHADHFTGHLSVPEPCNSGSPSTSVGPGSAEQLQHSCPEDAIGKQDPGEPLPEAIACELRRQFPGPGTTSLFRVSNLTQQGVEALRSSLVQQALADAGAGQAGDQMVMINQRQRSCIMVARQIVDEARRSIGVLPRDILVSMIRRSLESLDQLSGRNVTEAILDSIFSRFCIGK